MKKPIWLASVGIIFILSAFLFYGQMLEQRYYQHQIALLGRLEADPDLFFSEDTTQDIAKGKEILSQTNYQQEALQRLKQPYHFNQSYMFFICLGSCCLVFALMTYKKQQLVTNLTHQLERLSNNHDLDHLVDDAIIDHQLKMIQNHLHFWRNENNKTYQRMRYFIEDVSHQLKTPMTTLNIYYAMMSDQSLKEKSLQQLNKMNTILDTLIKLAKLESHTFHFELQTHAFTPILENVFERLKPEMENKQLHLKKEIQDVMFYMDPLWMEEAIFNLVQNAIDYAYPDTKICVQLTQCDSGINLSIQSQSDPIPPEILNHLFDRYYTSQKHSNHMGIGLNIADQIIQSHHGSIRITNLNQAITMQIHFDLLLGKQKL